MKVEAKQTSLDLDLAPRTPVVHKHPIDFTSMQIGHMAGNECRIIRCPVCDRHCIARERHHGWEFIHAASIRSTASKVKFESMVRCSLSHEHVRYMQDMGRIVRNRLGQILEVKSG